MSPVDDALAALNPEQRAALELLLRRERAAGSFPAPPAATAPIPRRADRASFPLSFAQQRLWFLDQLSPGDPASNIHGAARLRGRLASGALAASLRAITARHEALRARFTAVEGRPEQSLAPPGGPALPVVDLAGLPGRLRDAEVLRLAVEEARRPFDLARGPLLRTTLLQEGAEQAVLLLTMHHIVSDGWSIGVLLRDLSALYPQFARASGGALPPLPIQYADFAAWQRQRLAGDRLAREVAHWRSRLDGLPELRLPGAGTPPSQPAAARCGAVPLAVPAPLAERLGEIGRAAGASLFMTLLAVFEALLLRWTGQRDFAVGAPIANRDRPEVEGLIGFFVKTLVLRADLEGDPTFRGLLERVREVCLDAYAHHDLPFEKLVEELQPERRLGSNPLFSALFALQSALGGPSPESPAPILPGLELALLPVRNGTARFDLTLELTAGEAGLTGFLEHGPAILSPEAAARMAGHFLALLAAAAAEPLRPLSELPALTAAERHQILVEWAGPRQTWPDVGFGELLAAQAARSPESIAVVCDGERLSYRDLDARSDRLAWHLRRLGAGPEVAVAISVERSIDMVVGLLGILKTGAAYLPIDPLNPRERQSFMLEDCGAALLLTQERWAASFRRPGLRVVCLDADGESIACEPPGGGGFERAAGVGGNALAFLYTSGSTGLPKATVVEMRGMLNLCFWFREVCGIDASTRALLGFAFSFDAAFKNIVVPLLCGGRLVLANPGPFDPLEMWAAIRDEGVTFLNTTPSQMAPVLALAAADGFASLSSLQGLILGGEAAAWGELGPWLASGRCRSTLTNMYGPSECSDTITAYRAAPLEPLPDRLPVGRPGANMRLVVMDDDLQPLPVGVPGELCASGICLARGYYDRPELTAARFVPDPHCPSGLRGERLYRTGDLARWLPDGNLELLGRLDGQIKIRGVRIEPAEVEAALTAHPAVRSAVVAARTAAGETRLVAWIVPCEGAATPASQLDMELRYFLRGRLPEAMVPAVFVPLPALPLNPRGKLDRSALPEPGAEAQADDAALPRDPAEELVAALWAGVLGRERVGIHDNFFHLGGHSLLATRLVSRVRSAFGVELPVRRLFERPTVAGLVEAVREAKSSPPAPPLRRSAEAGPAPLSFAQRRLWIQHQIEPGSTVYNLPAGFRFGGSLDLEGLVWSLGEIVRRHEALRTRFPTSPTSPNADGEPVAAVAPPGPLTLPVIDLSGLAAAPREAAARELWQAAAHRPFDLARGPLLRLLLVRFGAADHSLVLIVHHIVSDGWSGAVFLRELSALYAAFLRGERSPLPDLPIQYGDFSRWQTGWLRGEALDAHLSWWRERLGGGADHLELPADRPRPSAPASLAGRVPLRLAAGRAAALRQLGLEVGTTLYMTLLAGLQALLARTANQESVRVGTPVAGRDRLETEGLIGFFVNTLVIQVDLGGDPSFRELLVRVREAVLSAWMHQDLPFEKLVEELRPVRQAGLSPLFQVLFALHNLPREELRLPGVAVSRLDLDPGTTAFDLAVALAETGEEVEGALRYRACLFSPAAAQRLAGHYLTFLQRAVAEPGRRLSELPLLSAAERHQVLEEWAGAEIARPELSLVELFAAQAARTPEVPAVVFAGVVLSYAELDRRADRVAWALLRLGVAAEARVALYLERSPDLLAAVLGVMKAGGAYVPLDPASPRERLAFLLADAEPTVVLTAADLVGALPAGLSVLLLEEALAAGGPARALPPPVSPDSLAYVIYTSGSTGRPKGTLGRHGALTAFAAGLCAAVDELREGAPLRLSLNAALSFDASLQQIVQLAAGHTLWLVPEEARRDGERLAAFLLEASLDGFDCTPSQLDLLLAAMAASGRPPRFVLVGGEPIPKALWERLAAWKGTRFYNVYGPTECTVDATVRPIEGRRPNAGRPLPGYRVHLLDAAIQPVPAGARGEVWIGGPALTRGYWRRPDLTADSFRPDPLAAEPGARRYRTGDLGRWLSDGNLELLGRLDQQVKIRGIRIEPAEVEAALRAHPAVRSAVVGARTAAGETRLVAWIVPCAGAAAPAPQLDMELRTFLRERLPEAMAPAVFVPLPALPLNPRGKLDRSALPEPDGEPHGEEAATPRDPAEEVVAALWAGVLGRERVGIHDNFFHLGGHSLLAARVIAKLRAEHGIELPVIRLFERPTVAGLVAAVREVSASFGAGAPSRPPPCRHERGDAAPLSFAQQRLWVLHQLTPGLLAYNMPAGLRLRGRLDTPALHGALAEILRRHEALRTRFEIRGDQPVQVVEPAAGLALPVIDLSALALPLRTAAGAALAVAEAAIPFDLGRPPLLRAWLLRMDAEEHLLLLTVHHIASDAWSMGVAIGELAALYPALAAGRPSPLRELPFQYADFAVEQRAALRGHALDGEIAFWRERLAGARPLDVATDRPRRAAPRFAGAAVSRLLPATAVQRLQRLAGEEEWATPFMALLTPLLALFARLTETDDVVVGTTISGRDRPEIGELIGFFVNTLVLRIDVSGDPDGGELLARVRRTVLQAFSHQAIPFDRLVDEVGLPRDPYRPPLLRVLIQHLALPGPALELPGLVLESIERTHDAAKLDLVINLRETPEGLRAGWIYDSELFDAPTILRLAEAFAALLAAWAEQPALRLSELPLLSSAERHQALYEWNAAVRAAPGPRLCLHQRFEAQADRDPRAVAVVEKGTALTYGDLEDWANRLAHGLIAHGVRPGDRVALCVERSAATVAALLAVLKAGAAYVPLDPAEPAERLAGVLADSGARLLLLGDGVTADLAVPGVRVLPLAWPLARNTARSGPARPRPSTRLAADPALPAYVIYTSGSSGRPKGVVVTHASVDRLLAVTAPGFGFGPRDVWTLFHSYAFDFSVWEIWGALAYGGRLVVVPYWVSRSPEDFLRLLARERVTVLNQTPSAFRQLLWAEESLPVFEDGPRPELALRLVIFGGEALEPASLRPWVRRHGLVHPALVNMYGITETTVHVTRHLLIEQDAGQGAAPAAERGSRIGRPLPDLSLHVLDRRLEPQPIGAPGELYVGGAGGAGLAQGYLGRPDLTAERFIPHPFCAGPSGEPGARLYRSGDLARRLPDGGLEYLGRIDQQVKIRGFRVEPGEIEAVLASHPGVRAAAVVAREDWPKGSADAAGHRLVAYVVPGPGGEEALEGLRDHLAARLPDAMVPSAVVVLDSLPLTANGKLDRRALPAPGQVASPRPGSPPRTSCERFLADLFAQVLGGDRAIGIEDDFFALGGTSITGAILVNRLQEALGEIVHVVVIFDRPTVASLAAYVADQHPRAARRLWGEDGSWDGDDTGAEPARPTIVGPAEIAEMRRIIAAGHEGGRQTPAAEAEAPNPPAVFVLSPPRSGTTLLRVMLGAHPALFAPPELELLSFTTMAERRAAFQGRDSFWLEGVIRAVMEARACPADEAEQIVEETERSGWTTRRFYRALQGWIGARILVDKTPSYTLDPQTLQRAEDGFAGTLYLHLTRHPQATNRSFEQAKLEQIFFRRPHAFRRRQLAELVWTVSHENILRFLAGIPEQRRHSVRFEDLVRDPGPVLAAICGFLGLHYRPEMAEPYRPGAARMTDGPHAVSRMLGDVKFLAHGKVDAAAAERWHDMGEPPLGEPTRAVASALGYAGQAGLAARAVPGRGVLVPLNVPRADSGAQGRRPLFCVHPVGGEVAAYRELARRLGPAQPFYGLQTPERPEGPLTGIADMASAYLESVRQLQPSGPYRFAGWSLGGLIAYEMACQAAASGETPETPEIPETTELLALIDVASPARLVLAAGRGEPDDAALLIRFARDQAGLFGVEAPAADLAGLDADAVLLRVLEIGRGAGFLAPGIELRDVRRLFERFRVNRRALRSYRPQPYAGDAVLFRAGDRVARMEEGEDPALGWGELITGRVTIVDLPGDHYSILRGGAAQRLADRLLQAL